MANELIYAAHPDDIGLAITFAVSSATAVINASVTATPHPTKAYVYIANMPAAVAGEYLVEVFDSSAFITSSTINWDGAREVGQGVSIDTKELQANQGNWLTATGFATQASLDALNDFNPAVDVVANVALVAVTTTNTDMRGTDSAVTTQVDVSSLATQASVDALPTLLEMEASTPLTTAADLSPLETKAQADARQVALIAQHSATQSALSNLNDFDPEFDTVANVALVAVTTTNTDMRGTDGATTTQVDISALATQSSVDQLPTLAEMEASTPLTATADVSDLETKAQADVRQTALLSESAATQSAINNLNDFDPTNDVVASVALVDVTTTNTDMRGTDNANTIAPNNAVLTSLDSNLSLVKQKTDKLTFTDTNAVSANMTEIKDRLITGEGTAQDEFDTA